ncbi:MAG: hypothetical protein M9927_04985 [Anaerolineae bacterium]|nr:hypothetical protein [Anaerolineae bacterium]
MNGPFTDEDQVKFESSVKAFEDATGIDIQHEGSKEFEASIGVRFEAKMPDIVDFLAARPDGDLRQSGQDRARYGHGS